MELKQGSSSGISGYHGDEYERRPSGIHDRLVSFKQTDVSEVRTASIIREMSEKRRCT
jgi:hypothetical protein